MIKEKIEEKAREFFKEEKRDLPPHRVPASAPILDEEDLVSMIDCSLDLWLTEGKRGERFSWLLSDYVGQKHAILVSSGSSANLLAISALTSHLIPQTRRLLPGDEVITTACSFPTTVNPIIINGAVPVFVDIETKTYNAIPELVEGAVSPKTKAIVLAHTLGNPFDVEKIQEIASRYNLWLIEDNCDGLGSEYNGRRTGSFGDMSTLSFYPAHQITTGEGGAVLTSNNLLRRILLSMRDWGRDCWCEAGGGNSCGKRFEQKHGDLPEGYDHKYTYSHLGYNLKMTEMQAAIGVSQMGKIHKFTQARRANHCFLNMRLHQGGLDPYFTPPSSLGRATPSWFGYAVTVNPDCLNRRDVIHDLEEAGISTRMLFAGNIIRQPYFKIGQYKHRVYGTLENTDMVTENSFWIGIHQALSQPHLEYVAQTLTAITRKHANRKDEPVVY